MGRADRPQSTYRPDAIEVVETRDGSATLYDADRDVHYSSLHGARDESRHIFVEGTGLAARAGDWHVLELGFGAGINFVQTAQRHADRRSERALVYHAVDYAPVAPSDVQFHEGRWGRWVREVLAAVDPEHPQPVSRCDTDLRVRLVLHPIDWLDLDVPKLRANAVFYDPFGPKSEPHSWSVECFRAARKHMRDDGILGTYSAATAVKRAMFDAGFAVASAPGPGPKREITYASPTPEALGDRQLLDRSRYLGGDD